MDDLTVTVQQYEALVALARRGADNDDRLRKLASFTKEVEEANGIITDSVWIQWQEMDQPLPPATRFPEVWPPELRWRIALTTRLVCRSDVDLVLEARASNPTNVLCTKDPAAVLGWTKLDSFFVR